MLNKQHFKKQQSKLNLIIDNWHFPYIKICNYNNLPDNLKKIVIKESIRKLLNNEL
jgi:hypothetical protein